LEGLKDGYYYSPDEKIRYRFEGWEVRKGNVSAPEASSFSFSVSGPVVVEARFGPPEYLVCIDSTCNYYREDYVVPTGQDVPELCSLLVSRFEGYTDPSGNSLGKSFTVNRPISATSAYRVKVNLPLLTAILVVLSLPVIVGLLKARRKAKREAEAGGGEAEHSTLRTCPRCGAPVELGAKY